MKTFALLAAAVVLPLTLSAPAPAHAQQTGHTYTNVNSDGDRYRSHRRGDARRRHAYVNRWRDDRRDHDRRDYRERDRRRGDDGRDYRRRDRRHADSGRDYRRRDSWRRHFSRDYRWRPWGSYFDYPRRVHRRAYRAPRHRHHFHNHRRLSRHEIRRRVLRHYPSVFRLDYRDGIYDVWARDRHGRSFRLGYDAFTGAFLTFFFLTSF